MVMMMMVCVMLYPVVPDTILNVFQIITHLTLTTMMWALLSAPVAWMRKWNHIEVN